MKKTIIRADHFCHNRKKTDGVKGKNKYDIKVTCKPNTTVYFYVGGNKGSGPIDTYADGQEHTF